MPAGVTITRHTPFHYHPPCCINVHFSSMQPLAAGHAARGCLWLYPHHAEGQDMTAVVRSLLETDLYKFTMWQAMLHSHPGAQSEYTFALRNDPVFPLAELKPELERELDHLCSISFTDDELEYLRRLRFMKSDFVDFLTVFRFQRKFLQVSTEGDELRIRAVGPQVHVMGFEIFILYIVNELYFRRFPQ